MKNKLFIGILACVLLTFAACGTSASKPAAQNAQQAGTELTSPEESTEQTEEVTTEATLPPVKGVEGTVLFNEDNFALVLTELDAGADGHTMTVTAVNRTDMKVYMRLMNFSVNSFMLENLPTLELDPEQTLEHTYTLSAQELADNGIEEITDLQFSLWVYDSKDFQTPDVAEGICRYYPQGKAGALTYERTPQPTDQVLVDNERFTVTITEVTVGEDIVLQLHLKNKSDKELLFIAPYATVDGEVIDPLWAYNVSAGKQRNTAITFTARDLKEAGVTEPQVVELPIQIGDHADWSAGVYFYELYTVSLTEEAEQTTEQ